MSGKGSNESPGKIDTRGRYPLGELGARQGCKGLRYLGEVGHEATIYGARTQEALHLVFGLRIPETPQCPEILLQYMYSSRPDDGAEVLHFFLKEVAFCRL